MTVLRGTGGSTMRRRATLFLVAALAFVTAFGLVSALPAGGTAGVDDGEGAVGERIHIYSGQLPGIGAYDLYYATDSSGAPCTAIQHGLPYGGPVVYEACGGPTDMNIGTLVDDGFTLFNGWIPKTSATVIASCIPRPPVNDEPPEPICPAVLGKASIISGPPGVPYDFIAHLAPAGMRVEEFEAIGEEGETLATQTWSGLNAD